VAPVIAATSVAAPSPSATPAPSLLGGMLDSAIEKTRSWQRERLQSLSDTNQGPTIKAPASRSSTPTKGEHGIDSEKLIGEKWMTWVGGFTLLLAIGFA